MLGRGSWMLRVVMTILLVWLPWLQGEFFHHELFNFVGRFHPLVLHFPIVIIALAVLFESLYGRYKDYRARQIVTITFRLGLYSSLLSILAGYLLYVNGDYSGRAMRLHLIGGCALAIMLIWSDYFRVRYIRERQLRFRLWFRALLFGSLLLVIFTGHHGGSVTHGVDFVTEPLVELNARKELANTKALKSPSSMLLFQDMILPALQDKCISCHNDQKTKGGLNMSSYDLMIEGGKSGEPILVAGDPAASALYHRIALPSDHDDYMPPEGKTPLREAVVELIRWWIAEGGQTTDSLGAGHPDAEWQQKIDAYIPSLAMQQYLASEARAARKKIGPKLRRLCYDLGMDVEPDLKSDSAYFVLSMRIPPQIITDETLAKIMPYRDAFSRVSLVSSDITDEGLYYLARMNNLKELILIKSCIKGNGLAYLKNLPKLELLNLSHTDVTNEHALEIMSFPALSSVYLFNAEVDENVRSALDKNLEQTKVTFEEGPYY